MHSERSCLNCKKVFYSSVHNQKYCSKICCDERSAAKDGGGIGRRYGLTTGQVGALSELIVCADLIRKGYEVFRAVSQHCSCDLTILKDGKLQRVEVRTGYRLRSGKASSLPTTKDQGRYDLFAIVVDGVPEYFPADSGQPDAPPFVPFKKTNDPKVYGCSN